MIVQVNFALSVLAASIAWLIGKRWEIVERRRLRYVEIVCRLSALLDTGDEKGRRELLDELSKLWIDGDRKVVLASEKALDSIEGSYEDSDLEVRKLVVAMRRDARFVWNRSDLMPNEIKFRSAKKAHDD